MINISLLEESKKLKKEAFSKTYELTNSLIYFNDENIIIENVKLSDLLVIKYSISNGQEKQGDNLVMKIKGLKKDVEEDAVWTLGSNSFINLYYELMSFPKINKKYITKQIINDANFIKEIKFDTIISGDLCSAGGEPTCSTHSTAKRQDNIFHNKKIEYNPLVIIDEEIKSQSKQKKLIKTEEKNKIKESKENSSDEMNDYCFQILEDNESIINQNNIFSKEYISKLKFSEYEYDTFCQCVLITGIKFGKVNLIEKSEYFPSSCGHKECSILQSATPSILYSYQNPNKKYQIDINDLTPYLVFPLGIKICLLYDSLNQYPKENKPFINRIENKKGESFYIVSLVYYKKMTFKKYEERYKINPLLSYSSKNRNNKFEQEIEIISKLALNEIIFVPECISLISRFPYFYQMGECLKALLSMSDNKKINLLVNHLINQIPVPYKNQEIMFYIPNNSMPLKLYSPFIFNIYNYQFINIFNYFSNQNIITIFYLMLMEQQILFIDNNFSTLSSISFLFLNLIYPFSWSNTYIPILSFSSVKFLESIIPYIMGADQSLVEYAIENQNIGNKVILVNISKNDIYLSNKKKINLKNLSKLLDLPKFPDIFEKNLNKKLDEIRQLNNNSIIAENLKYIFCKLMVVILSDYLEHCFVIDEFIVFNNESFLERKKPEEKNFYKELIQTQLFSQFLLSKKEQFIRNKKFIKNNLNNNNNMKKEASFESFLQDSNILSTKYGNMYDNLYIDYSLFYEFEKSYLLKSQKLKDNKINNKNKNISNINNLELNKSTKSEKRILTLNIGKQKNNLDKNESNEENNLNNSLKTKSIFNIKAMNISPTKKKNRKISNSFSKEQIKDNKVDYSFEESKKYKEITLKQKKRENESTFLLYPYFLETINENMTNKTKDIYIKNKINEIIKLDEEINKIIKEKNLPYYILPSYKRYEFFLINEDYKRYFPNSLRNYVNNGEKGKALSDFSSSSEEENHNKEQINTNNNKNINVNSNNKNDLSNKKIYDNNKDINYINEWFNVICSADKKKLKTYESSNIIKLLLNKRENLVYFIDLIFQDYIPYYKYINSNLKKILTYDCLNELSKVILKILPSLKRSDYLICKQLTLSFFIYGYYNQKVKNIRYIISRVSQLFHSSIALLSKVCPLWGEVGFWNFWLLDDLETNKNNNYFINLKLKELDESDEIDSNNDNIEFEILLNICEILILLGKNKNFIKKCIFEKIAPNYLTQYEIASLENKAFPEE